MLHTAQPKRGWVKSLAALAATASLLALSACTAGQPLALTPESAKTVGCDRAIPISNEIARLVNAAPPGERNSELPRWGLDPSNGAQVEAVQVSLRERAAECQAATASPSPSTTPTPSATPSASTSPTATPSVTETACEAKFVQDLDPNLNSRFVSKGFKGTSAAKREQFLAALAKDYRYLAAAVQMLFKEQLEPASLVTPDGTCLNEAGRTQYFRVEGAVLASGISDGNAPAGGHNTGIGKDGKIVVSSRPGVRGNTRGVWYTLADGTRFFVMDRCGNFVPTKKPRGVPHGPTDNPPEPKPTPTTKPSPSLSPKIVGQRPDKRGSVPPQVRGENPPARDEHKQTAKPSNPPATYTPPAPPKATPSPSAAKPTVQPSEAPAPGANDGGDGGKIPEPED